MRAYLVLAVATMACGCKRDRSHAPEPTPVGSAKPAADAANAEVVHEDPSPTGEARMFSAVVSDVDADGRPESQHGDETRVRAAVVVEGARGPTVLTVGHALKHQAVIGQILSWKLP